MGLSRDLIPNNFIDQIRDIASRLGELERRAFTGASSAGAELEEITVVNVKDFGARGDGVSDDTLTIQAAWDSLVSYAAIYFPAGNYMVSNTLYFTDKPFINVIGDQAIIKAIPTANFANRSLLDISASPYIYLNGINTVCNITDPAKKPQVILACGRNAGTYGSGGGVKIDNCLFAGNAKVSTFYNCCSEGFTVNQTTFQTVDAIPAYIDASQDLTTGIFAVADTSNVTKRFYGCSFLDYSGLSGNTLIRIDSTGGTKEISIRDAYFSIGVGGIGIEITGDTFVSGLVLDQIRLEAPATTGSPCFMKVNAGTGLYGSTFNQINVMAEIPVFLIDEDISECDFLTVVYFTGTQYEFILASDAMIFNNRINLLVSGAINVPSGSYATSNIIFMTQAGYPFSGTAVGTGYIRQDNLIFNSAAYAAYISIPRQRTELSTFSSTDTTPSVASGSFWYTNNLSATSITTFDDAQPGQEITVYFYDALTTLVHGTIKLSGSADWSPAAGSTITLIYWAAFGWLEKSRMAA